MNQDDDIQRELQFHVEERVADLVAGGTDADTAKRRAQLELGGVMQAREAVRDSAGRGLPLIDSLATDVRHSVRTMRRSPGFTAVVLTTLALGIGGVTAIFTVVDAVLLQPLNFAEPERLAMLRPSSGSRFSAAYLHDWRAESRTVRDMAGWHDIRVNLTGRGTPIEVNADRATPNFFALLGVRPILGRAFTVNAADLGSVEPEVVLSHGFWQGRFGGDPAIVGQPLTLGGQILTVVGVMPAGFTIRTNELVESHAELWMPFALTPGNRAGMGGFLNIVARLAPDTSVRQAQEELATIARRIEQEHPSYSRDWTVDVFPLLDATVKEVRLPLIVLFGSVGILLLIACANVATLILIRTANRQGELAIRLSLGATRGSLLRLFLVEGTVLAALGGSLGVVVAQWATTVLVAAVPSGLELPRTGEISVDLGVFAFTFVVTLLTALCFGLTPLWSSNESTPALALKHASSSTTPSGNRAGSALVVLQVSMTMVLLAGAGLLGRSLLELERIDPGFVPEHVVTARTTLPASEYNTDARVRAFGSELLERAGGLPGVIAVGLVNYLPMNRFGSAAMFEIEGQPPRQPDEQYGAWVSVVGGNYFEAMGIRLLRGRLPGASDTEKTQPVFVIDEGLARRHWPKNNPIGTRLIWSRGERGRFAGEIVGVVGSVRWGGFASDAAPTAYWWFPQTPVHEVTTVVRTPQDPIAVAGALAARVLEIDSNQPVADVAAMKDIVSNDLAQRRFTVLLVSVFAGAALIVAAIGLYGVIAFAATQRRREIGIRMALGARRGHVLRLTMRRGMVLTAIGLLCGTLAALALGRVVAGLLFGITPTDPATLVSTAIFLAAVALLATYLPARRASHLEPSSVLRG